MMMALIAAGEDYNHDVHHNDDNNKKDNYDGHEDNPDDGCILFIMMPMRISTVCRHSVGDSDEIMTGLKIVITTLLLLVIKNRTRMVVVLISSSTVGGSITQRII